MKGVAAAEPDPGSTSVSSDESLSVSLCELNLDRDRDREVGREPEGRLRLAGESGMGRPVTGSIGRSSFRSEASVGRTKPVLEPVQVSALADELLAGLETLSVAVTPLCSLVEDAELTAAEAEASRSLASRASSRSVSSMAGSTSLSGTGGLMERRDAEMLKRARRSDALREAMGRDRG